MAADKGKFNQMTSFVIDKLEGGYFNPQWHNVGDPRYVNSGETMFGIDRKAGGAINDTIAGKAFWSLIDQSKTPQTWKWNYKGGNLATALKAGASDIMYPEYEKNSKLYLSPEAKAIVDSDNRLLFHFIYGTWNGPGWFKKFAGDINKAVASGIKDSDKLTQVAIDSRTKEGLRVGSKPNSLIAQGGNKIAGFINDLKDYTTTVTEATIAEVKKKPLLTAIVITGMAIALFLLIKTVKQSK